MLKVHAHEYISLGRDMEALIALLHMADADEMGALMLDLASHFMKLQGHCEKLNLETSTELIRGAIIDLPETDRELLIYINAIEAELKSKLFLFVPPDEARYYEDQVVLPIGLQKFKEASKELIRAGNCYAFGEHTACVFHCMRATEIALKIVAKHLKVKTKNPIDQSEWQSLIRAIDNHLKKLEQQPRSAKRERDLRFFGDANSQFSNFKDAFRNHVAHARETYDQIRAIGIYHRVVGFFEVLSERLAEPPAVI